jgi:type IV pilus assembly protein PilA
MVRSLLLLLVAAPALAAPSLVDVLPPDARAAVVVQRGALVAVQKPVDNDPQMRAELSAFLERTLGADATRLDSAIVWSTRLDPQPNPAAFLRMPVAGSLRGVPLGKHLGADIVELKPGIAAAAVAGGVVVAAEPDIRPAIAAAQARAGASTALGKLLAADRSADLMMAVLVDKEPSLAPVAAQWGVRTGTLALRADGQIVVELAGDPVKLESARQLVVSMERVAEATLKQRKEVAQNGDDVVEGVAAIFGYYQGMSLWKELQPRLVGDRLVTSYRFPKLEGAGAVVPIMGALAATAIPAFMKYIRRAKTVEATMNLRKLFDSGVAYYEAHPGKSFAFPRSTDWTPSRGCCGRPGDKCPVDPTAWAKEPWPSLNFAVDDPHYYQYRITSSGKGPKAKMIIEARGDLDCDGKFSLFRREIRLLENGDASGGAGLFMQDELE